MEGFLTNPYVLAAPGIIALFVILGERVAAVTETKTDDAVFAAIHKALSALGLKFPEVK